MGEARGRAHHRPLASGETIDITEVEERELQRLDIVAGRKVRSHKVEYYLLSGEEVLEGPNQWPGRSIPIFPVIGSETALESKVLRSGLIRFSRDPQQLYNFWRSAAAEAIALAPRAPFLATPAMIAKFKGQWDTQNTVARPYLLYEPDPDAPGGPPMREPPPDIPAALVQESAIASDEMKATTGIYDAALGAQRSQSGGRPQDFAHPKTTRALSPSRLCGKSGLKCGRARRARRRSLRPGQRRTPGRNRQPASARRRPNSTPSCITRASP